jgi:tetratricopeptide (TPR) repeat protein
VTDRLLVDLDADRQVSVSTWLDGELPGSAVDAAVPLRWPLDGEALDDLRWYLEDYLRAPYGVYDDRGSEVARALKAWGVEVFDAVFGSGAARDAYVKARARSGVGTEIVFRSASAELLGLPWELLRDPGRPTPLALDLVGVTRSLPTSALREAFAVAGERLRVLMVISRPAGTADVGYRMVARPLLDRLEAVRGQVDLVVLRPPTLDNLGAVLAAARAEGQPFQVVHFDGHGVMSRRRDTGVTFEGVEGMLAFEKPEGGAEDVPAAALAQVLAEAEVPLVVLNACQSGAVGKELEAAVATRLLQEGAASVVAMAYAVYAVAAAEFMAAFYERLFAGDHVTEAVTEGRRRLARSNHRPSPKGDLPLEDWLVPVHYRRRDVHFPYLRSAEPERPFDLVLDELRENVAEADRSLEPVETFVGRDSLFYELEVAARHQRVVVLHGPGGTGKTELAKAFGRWLRDTGGVDRPDLVIFQSFEPGVASFGLDGIVAQVGLHCFGPDFAQLDADGRRKAVERVLQEHRLLLIWDNFESVHSMPAPATATPPLTDEECDRIRDFLQLLARSGRSAVIVTSRSDEAWLGDLRRIELGGLTPDEAIEYADQCLAAYPSTIARRARPAFAELLQHLDGHPLSMRLVLPHLDTTEPENLLDALRGLEALPEQPHEEGRTKSLTASLKYSVDHLGPDTRRLLVAVCLFRGVADVDVLTMMSEVEDLPERFAGADRPAWTNALDGAAHVGLLTDIGAGMYRIHPALPAFLAEQWRQEEPEDHVGVRDAATRAVLVAHAKLAAWLSQTIQGGDAAFAYSVVDRERHTLGHLLGYALDHQLWPEATRIAQALNFYFDTRGLYEEARAWVDRGRLALEEPDGTPPAAPGHAGLLWVQLVLAQARRDRDAQRLDTAERLARELLSVLETEKDLETRQNLLPLVFHLLGRLAEDAGRFEDAGDWFRQTLALYEETGDEPGMATVYHHLGTLAHRRDDLDEADEWYRQSLAIDERRGNQTGMVASYHQLGSLARDSLRLDEAEDWYGKAFALITRMDDRSALGKCCHSLGAVAQDRGKLDEAERWYQQALVIHERLGDPGSMAITFGQLGLLAEDRGRDRQALDWTVRCVALFPEFPHPATGPAPYHLARLTVKLGVSALEESWTAATGGPLPQAVRDFIEQA